MPLNYTLPPLHQEPSFPAELPPAGEVPPFREVRMTVCRGFASTIRSAATFVSAYTLSGLTACGLLDPKYVGMNRRAGFDVPKPLFLAVAATYVTLTYVLAARVTGILAAALPESCGSGTSSAAPVC